MIYLFWLGVVFILIAATAEDPCPREALGYRCRGKQCDHNNERDK